MSKTKLRNLTVFSIAGAAFFGFVLRVTPCMEGFLIAAAFWGLIWLAILYVQRSPATPVSTVKRNPSRATVQNNRRASANARRPVTNTPSVSSTPQPRQLPPMPPKISKGSSRLFVPPSLD